MAAKNLGPSKARVQARRGFKQGPRFIETQGLEPKARPITVPSAERTYNLAFYSKVAL